MKKLIFSILMCGLTTVMYAYNIRGLRPSGDGESDTESRAAGCFPADELVFMDFNNVKALVETGGLLWQDRAAGSNGQPSYEFPKGSENHVLFSGALWMGGVDINGQLKLAAHLYRANGNDFWPGPLGDLISGSGNYDPFVPQTSDVQLFRENGAAEIIPSECSKYDKFFTIRKAEVLLFISWWNCENGLSEPEDCEDVVRPDEELIGRIRDWPAHGNTDLGEDFYLAPFYDNAKPGETGNGIYDPITDGDYPWYDIEKEVDCRNDRRVTLFGDETHWWVFNDKGNIHTETNGDPIGMEIRAQAFSFATDDEINDMTFYNYELINRGTQTLFESYFGQFADPDIGFSEDDYVGCDVSRGLGYVFNGDLNDEGGAGGQPGYGSNPPAVGIDFFEGPYLDNDNEDNPIYKEVADEEGPAVSLSEVFEKDGIPYKGLGIGYGDDVIDNERFGMARFVYFDRLTPPYNDPSSATDYYNYLRGIWKTGATMNFGGNGHGTSTGVPTKFMLPDDSDPLGWGTYPAPLPSTDPWSEISEGNPVGDRRFAQSAGPFTLKPGAVNNITVGVVVAQSTETDIEASVRALKTADTKAQALFDNCFKLVEPPIAPLLTIQEMENELIIYLSDPVGVKPLELYEEEDNINIITPDDLIGTPEEYDNIFRFEGFQVYQMSDNLASVSEIGDLAKARLVAQSDVQNGVGRLVNYTFDEELTLSIPAVMVEAAGDQELDAGLRRSFRITEDLFATGDRVLVNHKKYYYIAVSYAYNLYKEYDPNDPTLLDGQKRPYLRSRLSATLSGIESVVGIPHDPSPEADGRIFTTSYGFQPEIKQVEGIGNGGTFLELTQGTVDLILQDGKVDHPIYQSGAGPIDIKVIDPLNLVAGDYKLIFGKDSSSIDEDTWRLVRAYNEGGSTITDTVYSFKEISVVREQLILDWGISLTVNQQFYEGTGGNIFTPPIGATISYSDSSNRWLSFVEDDDSFYPSNWIRVGNSAENANNTDDSPNAQCVAENWIFQPCHYDDFPLDATDQLYEQLLGGGIAPFKFVGKGPYGNPFGFPGENTNTPWYDANTSWFIQAGAIQNQLKMSELNDVDIIITSDKTKWSNCPVIEMNDNETQTEHADDVLTPRRDLSVDKEGLNIDEGGNADEIGPYETGMGWFPGYAIDVNTGERLNMVFSENSWLKGDNGDDMIWNPTSNYADNVSDPLFGGMHYVYVFGGKNAAGIDEAEPYDRGFWLRKMFQVNESNGRGNTGDYSDAWKTCQWVMEPMLARDQELLSSDVKISARINKPFEVREVNFENESFPLYEFSFDTPSISGNGERLISVIDNINIVPNPYYAYSEYETAKRDNRVKITNLPERCEVTIFNMQGALVRNFVKDDPLTSLDWDLKNHQGIPIAGGMYIIHIKMDIISEDGSTQEYEKIIKWYGVLRQIDLDNL